MNLQQKSLASMQIERTGNVHTNTLAPEFPFKF